MDNVQDFEIKDESSDGKTQYTLYCKGLARTRLEEYNGRLFVQQIMIGPIPVDDFMVFAHGLTEFLLLVEGVTNDYKKRKAAKSQGTERKDRGERKRRRRRV